MLKKAVSILEESIGVCDSGLMAYVYICLGKCWMGEVGEAGEMLSEVMECETLKADQCS